MAYGRGFPSSSVQFLMANPLDSTSNGGSVQFIAENTHFVYIDTIGNSRRALWNRNFVTIIYDKYERGEGGKN